MFFKVVGGDGVGWCGTGISESLYQTERATKKLLYVQACRLCSAPSGGYKTWPSVGKWCIRSGNRALNGFTMQQVSIGFSRLKCIFSDFSSDLACVRVCVCVRRGGGGGGK